MNYEIDFLPVGDGSRSGDAICLRYSYDAGNSWQVGVIDGGTKNSGEELCKHIREYYKTETVNFLISTHPDQDHASGLTTVLEQITVEKVIMHCPWDYIDHIFEAVNDGRVTKESLRRRLIEGHPYAYELYETALTLGIQIYHPFSDNNNYGVPGLSIIGPSADFYLKQLIDFRSINDITEDQDQDINLIDELAKAIRKTVNWISETWNEEKLVDPEADATSAENSSSVISYFDLDGHRFLFTADAGVAALHHAADKMESLGLPLRSFKFVQAPHHGSKRNIGPTVLNRLIGEPALFGTETNYTTYISAAVEGEPKHPNKRVVNAFIRRGGKVIATQGTAKCLSPGGAPDRGWGNAEPLPFYSAVEDDD